MYDEIEIREIIFDAQSKIDRLFVGLKVVVLEDEEVATEKDVAKALSDRQNAGLSAHDNVEYVPIRASDPTLHSRPNWLASSRNNSPLFSSSSISEPLQRAKISYLRRLYDRALVMFKSLFNRQKAVIAPVVSKHKNKAVGRVFKDGVSQ